MRSRRVMQASLDGASRMVWCGGGNSNLADELCKGVELHEHVSAAELAAWTMLVSTIYNLDITKTRG